MDRYWMKSPRISQEYENGVEQFLQFATSNATPEHGNYFCPCVKCGNGRRQPLNEIRSHLICHGIILSYTKWICHGELPDMPTSQTTAQFDVDTGCHIEDMLRDLGQANFRQAHAPTYEKLQSDSEIPLYSECTTYTRLSAVLALVNLKARFGWSDKSFTELLVLLKKMLPEDNTLPKSHYEAKKILCPMGMQYQKIHACPNDCVLYRNDFADLQNCPTCGVSRYKLNEDEYLDEPGRNNTRLAKVCWYLPIVPRFQRLFANADDAKNLTWHAHQRQTDGLL